MGTMRQRIPGTWELVVSAGLDSCHRSLPAGVSHDQDTSKREVKAALTDLEAAVAAGKVSLDDMTFADLLEWARRIVVAPWFDVDDRSDERIR